MNYYQNNRHEILKKGHEKYQNGGGKEKAKKYYRENKEEIKKREREKYRKLDRFEKKDKIRRSLSVVKGFNRTIFGIKNSGVLTWSELSLFIFGFSKLLIVFNSLFIIFYCSFKILLAFGSSKLFIVFCKVLVFVDCLLLFIFGSSKLFIVFSKLLLIIVASFKYYYLFWFF